MFGIIKSAMGLTCFHLCGIGNVAAEWTLTHWHTTADASTACWLHEQTMRCKLAKSLQVQSDRLLVLLCHKIF